MAQCVGQFHSARVHEAQRRNIVRMRTDINLIGGKKATHWRGAIPSPEIVPVVTRSNCE